jgi:uncharacterized protein (TIGR01777 family)
MDIFPQVLITGTSGLIGSALCSRFQKESIPWATLVRKPEVSASAYLWDPLHFEFREEMRRLNGVRAVIHLSGENVATGRWTLEKKRNIRESRVRSTQAMLELLSQLERKPDVFLCASAVGYYGDRGDEMLDESSVVGMGFLAEVCREWEETASKVAELGIRVVNLRFGVILAAAGGALAKMLPVFRLGAGGRMGNGEQWMSWVSLPDVLRIIEFCMEDVRIEGPVNVVAPNAATNAEFTRTLARHLHRPALLPVPAFGLRVALGEMADAALLASAHAVPARLRDTGFVFDHPTLNRALQGVLPN